MTTKSLTNSGLKSNHYYLCLNRKRSLEDLEKMIREYWVVFFISFVLVANGNLCHAFMELQALSMIDFRNGEDQDYLNKCGKLVYWSTIIKTD
jgi:hypothetical protein